MVTPIQFEADAPWMARYRAAIAYGVQIASDRPERGLAVNDATGVDQLYAWDVPSGALRQLTSKAEGVGLTGDGIIEGVLTPNGQHIYYLDDRKGDETGHFVRVPYEGGPPADITPDLPLYAGLALSLSADGSQLGFTAIIDGQYRQYALAVSHDGVLGRPELLHSSERQAIGPVFSRDGTLVVIQLKREHGASYDLSALDVASGSEIARLAEQGEAGLEVYLASPAHDDPRWLATNSRSGYERPLLWSPRTGERIDLPLDEIAGDIIPMDWSPDGRRLLLRQNLGVAQNLYELDLSTASVRHIAHPGGAIGSTEPRSIWYGPGGSIYARWESSAHPLCTLRLDATASQATAADWRVAVAGVMVPSGHAWRSVEFASSDGARVQAWLGVPEGDGPFPTILEMHGGPEFAVTDVFSPISQCWLDHGFAYLTVNYRGSTGFGSAFQEKIRGDLGHWEVEDIVAARDWLVAQGVTEPKSLFLTGWSYGGYLTLMALGKRPDLWAGGMAGIALADLAMNDADGSTIAEYLRGLMGGSPADMPERYAVSSPITYVERHAAPVLLLQGRNDTRCTPRQIEAYVERAQAAGKHVEVHWFDSGHSGMSTADRIQQQELMLRFAYATLGQTV